MTSENSNYWKSQVDSGSTEITIEQLKEYGKKLEEEGRKPFYDIMSLAEFERKYGKVEERREY